MPANPPAFTGNAYNPFKDIPTSNYSLVGNNNVGDGLGNIASMNSAYE